MKKLILSSLVMLASLSNLQAQINPQEVRLNCGTKINEQQSQYIKSVLGDPAFHDGHTIVPLSSPTPHDVMVQFHIVCSGNAGTAPVTVAEINSALAVMNTKFAATSAADYLHFVQCAPPRYILNSPLYHFSEGYDPDEQEIAHDDAQNAMNVYIFYTIGIGTTAGYTYPPYSGSRLYLATNIQSHISGHPDPSTNLANGLVLTHEMGHFYGLKHLNGDAASGGTTEFVDGTNWNTAGDLLGDTPADPCWQAYLNSTSCTYPVLPAGSPCALSPSFCDAHGATYTPLTNNIMFPVSCSNFNSFTLDQCNRIYGWYTWIISGDARRWKGHWDLMSRDEAGYDEAGFNPNSASFRGWWHIWESPDIWNCRTSSTCLVNEPPGYSSSTAYNYMRVRIKNNSCTTYPGSSAVLHAYWTLGNTGETWPGSWTTATLCGLPAGGELGTGQTIPPIAGGASTILTFAWQPINPSSYTCTSLVQNMGYPEICFLSRIVDPVNDPMYYEIAGPITAVVTNNNNNVTRNSYLVNLPGHKTYHPAPPTVLLQSAANQAAVVNLHIRDVTGDNTHNYFNNGTLTLTLSDGAWANWNQNGNIGVGIQVLDAQKHQILVTSDNAQINNLYMPADEVNSIALDFYLADTTGDTTHRKFMLYQAQPSNDPNNPEDVMVGSACTFDVSISPEYDNQPVQRQIKPATNIISQNNFTVYPNPAHGIATVEIDLVQATTGNIDVLDITGKKIMTAIHTKNYESGVNVEMLNLSTLPSGVYLLRVQTGVESKVLKVSLNN